jgi:hypothetical protein
VADSGQTYIEGSFDHVETISLVYPGTPRNAETLIVDPATQDLYIITKEENNAGVYLAGYPYSFSDDNTLEYLTSISIEVASGGDISPDGSEILITNGTNIYRFNRNPQQGITEALNSVPEIVPYIPEPNGEAVSWRNDKTGYYTASEQAANIHPHLYYYPYDNPTSVDYGNIIPFQFELKQNYPNPFNPTTTISYSIAQSYPHLKGGGFLSVKLVVLDILGKEIITLVNTNQNPGDYKVVFNAEGLSSGVYFYSLRAGNYNSVKKMLLTK